MGKAVLTSLGTNPKLKDLVREHERSGQEPQGSEATREMSQLEERMRRDLEGVQLEDDDVGSEVRHSAREKNKDVAGVLGGPQGVGRATSFEGTRRKESFSMQPSETGPYGVEPEDFFGPTSAPMEHGGPEMTGGAFFLTSRDEQQSV